MRHLLSAMIVACAPVAAAGAQAAEYAVKIVCGPPDHPAVANGYYYTAINVHNPSRETAKLRWKVALTLPGTAPGPVTTFVGADLKPDQALEIECRDLIMAKPPQMRFYKGFVVIQSETELDVVGVYTAAQSIEGRVVALDIERVPVRRRAQ